MSLTAYQNLDLLHRIAAPDQPIRSIAELAAELNRDVSNTRKSIAKLTVDGVLARASSEDAASLALTTVGARLLRGFDLGAGVLDVPADAFLVLHAGLAPNPDNPRREMADLDGLAASIAEAGRILQPLLVSAPDANGVRLVWAGERRWRAVGLLIADGRWPADRPLPCSEAPPPPELAEAYGSYIGLVENTQREDLRQIDQARAYVALIQRTGWSAREAAKRTGREPRIVQEYVKVLREADPQALAAHEADPVAHPWTALRDGVKQPEPPAPDLTPKMILSLVELADAVSRYGRDGATTIRPEGGGVLEPLIAGGWVISTREPGGRRTARVTALGSAWMEKHGLQPTADTRAAILRLVRQGVVGTGQMFYAERTDSYVTPWLCLPTPLPNAPAAEAATVEQDDEPALPLEPEPEGPQLSPHARLALVEAAHAIIGQHGEYSGDVSVGKYWLSRAASDLVTARLIMFRNPGGASGWVVSLTEAGWGQLDDVLPPDDEDIDAARIAAGQASWTGPGYATEWLNPAPVSQEAAPVTPAPAEDEPDDEAEDTAAEDAECLRAVRELAPEQEGLARRVSDLLACLGFTLPLTAPRDADVGSVLDADGAQLCVADPHHEISDDRAVALAALIALSVNIAAGALPRGAA